MGPSHFGAISYIAASDQIGGVNLSSNIFVSFSFVTISGMVILNIMEMRVSFEVELQ